MSKELLINYNEAKDKENVAYLTNRLYKECQNSKGYLGVETDNLHIEPNNDIHSLTESLFDKILREINVLDGQPDEYVDEWGDGELPFRTLKNVEQHIKRLGKFVNKYAPKYLSEEKSNKFIKEVKTYVKL